MIMVMTAVLLAVDVLLLLPVLLFVLEVAAAALTTRPWQAPTTAPGRAPAMVVLIPAHNEGTGLLPLLTDLSGATRTLVVADNCTDGTAAIARAAGAGVIERHDPTRRGKGFALDFGIAHLASKPPEVVVIIDADCRASSATVSHLASLCAQTNRPVQSAYTMHPADASNHAQRVAEFAWDLNTYVRSVGLARCGWPARLAGTGMAIPWAALTKIDLATGNIVEYGLRRRTATPVAGASRWQRRSFGSRARSSDSAARAAGSGGCRVGVSGPSGRAAGGGVAGLVPAHGGTSLARVRHRAGVRSFRAGRLAGERCRRAALLCVRQGGNLLDRLCRRPHLGPHRPQLTLVLISL